MADYFPRWNLKSRRIYGENADADRGAIRRSLPDLHYGIRRLGDQKYSLDDVWIADETGCFYQRALDRTIGKSTYCIFRRATVARRKKEKVRLIVLFCSNAFGNEKMPLMIIGKARKARAFQIKQSKNSALTIGIIRKPG